MLGFHQLLQMIFKYPALLDSTSLITMVLAIQALVPSCRVTDILLNHRKYDSFLICSKILWTGSLNATLTSSIWMLGSWILNSLLSFDWKPLVHESFAYYELTGALPLFCCWSSPNLLYSLIRLISYRMFLGGLIVNKFRNSKSSGSPNLRPPIVAPDYTS